MVLKGEIKVEDIMEKIAKKHAALSTMKMIMLDTDEEREAYMEGFTDVMDMMNELSEKVEKEKEKSFHNPGFDDLINAFLFGNEEE